MFDMYLLVIAWMYVIIMFSVAQSSWVVGVLFFLMMGVLPLWLYTWHLKIKLRNRREQAEAEKPAKSSVE